MIRHSFAAAVLIVLATPALARAQSTVHVTDEFSLRNALNAAVNGDTIVFDNSIVLDNDVPSVSRNITIEGGGFTLSGQNEYRGFFVASYAGATAQPVSVTIQNLNFQNTLAEGGKGGYGTVGGGGGAGLGGALYVGDQANVTIINVNFSANGASGGGGGDGAVGVGSGGGGGLGGDGGLGDSVSGAGGGGGGVGRGGVSTGQAYGGSFNTPNGGAGILLNSLAGGSSTAGSGGSQAGGGAVGGAVISTFSIIEGGGGGGLGGGNSTANPAGAPGGFGGGSGGSSNTSTLGASAGFGGGGGGGTGGAGGFGGGGGGSTGTNAGGYAAGSGAQGGGGGAGLGGAVFVQSGGTLTIAGATNLTGNSVAGGAGASGGGAGSSFGSGFFLQGSGVLTFAPGSTQTQTVSDGIADQTGSTGSGGSWTVTKNGAGTLNLYGANTFTGGVVVNAGSLGLNGDGNLGVGGTLALNSGNAVVFTGSPTFSHAATIAGTSPFRVGGGQSVTWAGTIADGGSAGSLLLDGGGVLSLTNGTNSYSGGTAVVNGSALVVNADGGMGTGGLTLGDGGSNGTLRALDGTGLSSFRSVSLGGGGGIIDTVGSASVSLNGSVGGEGSLTKIGSGTLTLGGRNSYLGVTNLNAGTLRAAASNVFGSNAMNAGAGTTLDLNGFSQTLASLSGSGLVLLGNATLSTGGSGASTTFSGAITGGGAFVKTGGGTLTLQGANTYTGGTTISGGTLSGNTTSLQRNILNNAAVAFTQASDGVFNGLLSGNGSLLKTGAGRLTLNGSHSMTGLSTINQGSLALNGSLAGSVLVNGGTRFVLAGTVGGGVTVNGGAFDVAGVVNGGVTMNGGTLAVTGTLPSGAPLVGSFTPRTAAGDLPASLTIGGNLVATNGATITAAVASATQAPIAASGGGSISDSHLNLQFAGLTTNGRVSTFSAISAAQGLSITNTDINVLSVPTGFVPLLSEDKTTLLLTLLNTSMPLAPAATTDNGKAVGAAIDQVRLTAGGDLGKVVRELTLLDDPRLDEAFKAIAGEIHGTAIHLAALDTEAFTELVRDEIGARENDADEAGGGGSRPASRPEVWAQIHGDRATFDSVDGTSGADARVGGFASGVDWHFAEKFFVGAGGGYSNGTLDADAFDGSSHVSAPHAFGYAGFDPPGPWAVNVGSSISRASYDTRRHVAFASTFPGSTGVDREAVSSQDGINKDVWSEVEDSLKAAGWTYNWRIGYRKASYERGPWKETGAQSLSLQAPEQSESSSQSDVRLNGFKRTGSIRPHWSLAYKREFGDRATSTQVELTDAPEAQFVVDGLPLALNTMTALGGVTFHSSLGLQYTLDYQVHRADGQLDQGLHFRVRFK